ncbi:DUF3168 domain-containing protein [Stappia indica]|uniref:DUF3168 domain-containing protein n=1 Tax=Stappia indica TaxID=538381 RepID=A0A857CED5_9HYPH|nr:DUF3168 domain-containing protein [Stappia indica]QGZ36802.1 DUF3168 domain-containing protein [Stappia indica]
MSAQVALRAALVKALRADAQLTALTGGERVHDGAPRGSAHPFIELGALVSRPLLSSAEEGEEHEAEILVHSRKDARGEVAALMAAAREAVLNGAGGFLDGHVLVNAGTLDERSERLADGRSWRGRLRLRLVSEPAE